VSLPEKRQTGPQARRTFHLNRIRATRNGVLRFWWAAWWVTAELKALARRDEATAHQQGLVLADQLTAFADNLNNQHHTDLMKRRGGRTGVRV
jgi:hypothetical protein